MTGKTNIRTHHRTLYTARGRRREIEGGAQGFRIEGGAQGFSLV